MSSRPKSEIDRVVAALLASAIAACAQFAEAQAPTASWTLAVDHIIGDDRQESTRFTAIRGLSVNSAGDVFVLDDSKTPDIRMFNARGVFVKRVARSGHGPGELDGSNGMLTIPSGGFVVNDDSNGRVTIWSDKGAYLRQIPLTSLLREWVWRSGWDAERRLIEIAKVPRSNIPPGKEALSLRRIPIDGKAIDVVPLPGCPTAGPQPVIFFTGKKNAGPGMMVPFGPIPRQTIDNQGYLWCTPGSEYRIERYRIGSGEKPLVLTRTVAVEPVPKASYDSAVAVVNKFKARWVVSNADIALVPKTFPAVTALVTDNKNRLWVQRPPKGKSLARFDVWDAGKLIATVEGALALAPEMPVWIVGDTFYGVAVDDDGVQSIVVARVVRNAAQGTATSVRTASDTIRGVIRRVGNEPVSVLVLSSNAGEVYALRGALLTQLNQATGLEVMLQGSRSDKRDYSASPRGAVVFDVDQFFVRAADGKVATDGVLTKRGDKYFLLRGNDAAVEVPFLPRALLGKIGSRVFLVGPLGKTPDAYGVLSERK